MPQLLHILPLYPSFPPNTICYIAISNIPTLSFIYTNLESLRQCTHIPATRGVSTVIKGADTRLCWWHVRGAATRWSCSDSRRRRLGAAAVCWKYTKSKI